MAHQLNTAEVHSAEKYAVTFNGNRFPVAFCSDGNTHKAAPAQYPPSVVDAGPTPKPAMSQNTPFLNE